MADRISRRAMLTTSVVGAAGLAVAQPETNPAMTTAAPKRALRIAHLTDIHVQPEKRAGQWMAKCLQHVQSLADPPQLILNGGDCIMDSFHSPIDRTKLQWDVWKTAVKNELSVPIESCLGNHDIWGWNKVESATDGSEWHWGKELGMEMLGMEKRYRRFSRNGWHFIVLDSMQPRGVDSFFACLDEEQFQWLASELASIPAAEPVLVLSHIPILSAAAFLNGNNEKTGDWAVPGAAMHTDSRRIKDLFYKHKNVKLALSGHLHLVDRVDYLGVTYLCNGAVCGRWWDGNHQEFEPGCGVIDLFEDGSFRNEYVRYGWKA